MFCPRCGSAVPPGATFCGSCGQAVPTGPPPTGAGAPLPSPPPAAPPPAPIFAPPPAPARTGGPALAVIILILVVVGVLIVAGVLAVFLLSAPPPTPRTGDCVAIHQGDTFTYGPVTQPDCQAFCDQLEANSGVPVTACTWTPR